MKKIIGPYIKSKNTTNRMMLNLLIALLPIIVFSVYKNGFLPYQADKISFINMFYPLLFILLPATVSGLFEILYSIIFLKKRNKDIINYIKQSYSFFPGLFLGLILPINIPIWIVLIGALIASLTKIILKRVGKNLFNSTLIGYLFIFIVFTGYFQNSSIYLNKLEFESFNSTPITNISAVEGIGDYNSLVKPYGSLLNLFIGMVPGGVGETSILLCFVGFIYLIITKSIKWRISLVYILTVFFATFLIGNINDLQIWYPLFQIFSGSLIFGSIFIATDSITSPTTLHGQILYGLFLGIITIAIRYLTPLSEGVYIGILVMNIFTKFFDEIGSRAKFDFRVSLLPYLISWVLIIGLGFYIGNIYVEQASRIDSNFEIISRETMNNKTTYIVIQKGYSSDIKGEIVINKEKVLSFTILEHNESFYHKIESTNYLDTLINNQFSLEKVQPVSGAFVTSNALKKMLQNVVSDYKNYVIPDILDDVKDFELLDIENNNDKVIYNVKKLSGDSTIELRITFVHDVIEEITIINQDDPYFNYIIDSNYITKIISNQQKLDSIEDIEDAVITSQALKTAVKMTIEDYQNKMGLVS